MLWWEVSGVTLSKWRFMIDERAMTERWEAMKGCLDERQRRLFAAAEARAVGRGGLAAVGRVTGMAQTTLRRGMRDLAAGESWEPGRVRRSGAGRPSVLERDPGVEKALDGLLEPVTVGDPERVSVRWTSKSAAKLAEDLRALGHELVDRTVLRLLKGMGFSMQGNYKTREGADHPDRDAAIGTTPSTQRQTERLLRRDLLEGVLDVEEPQRPEPRSGLWCDQANRSDRRLPQRTRVGGRLDILPNEAKIRLHPRRTLR